MKRSLSTTPIVPAAVLHDALAELVDKSVVVREDLDGRTRYRLLETVRQFGLNRLRAGGDREYAALLMRHRDWYLALAERFEAEWFGPRQVRWLGELRTECANLRAALDASVTTPGWAETGLRIAAALLYFWLAGGELREGCDWLDRALRASPQPSRARARALHAFCRVLVQSEQDRRPGSERAEEGLRLAQRFVDALVSKGQMDLIADFASQSSGPSPQTTRPIKSSVCAAPTVQRTRACRHSESEISAAGRSSRVARRLTGCSTSG